MQKLKKWDVVKSSDDQIILITEDQTIEDDFIQGVILEEGGEVMVKNTEDFNLEYLTKVSNL